MEKDDLYRKLYLSNLYHTPKNGGYKIDIIHILRSQIKNKNPIIYLS